MFRWKIQAQAQAAALPRHVWEIWTDVASWPCWDRELEWSRLEGGFQSGSQGTLKPKGWPASSFFLTEVNHEKGFRDKTAMPLTEVVFTHSLLPGEKGRVRIVHQVEVSGLLAPLLRLTMGRSLKKNLPLAVERLARLAEEKQGEGR